MQNYIYLYKTRLTTRLEALLSFISSGRLCMDRADVLTIMIIVQFLFYDAMVVYSYKKLTWSLATIYFITNRFANSLSMLETKSGSNPTGLRVV